MWLVKEIHKYYTFYKYKLSVLHMYFGPHSFWIDNLTRDLKIHHFHQI